MQNPRRRRPVARRSPVRTLITNLQKSLREIEERLQAVEEELYDRDEYDIEFELEEENAGIGIGSSAQVEELGQQLINILAAQQCQCTGNIGIGSSVPACSVVEDFSACCSQPTGIGSSSVGVGSSSAETCSFCGSYCDCCGC